MERYVIERNMPGAGKMSSEDAHKGTARSLEVLKDCQLEPSLKEAKPGTPIQFERLGYFCVDAKDSRPGQPVFNRTVTMKDAWAKEQQKG